MKHAEPLTAAGETLDPLGGEFAPADRSPAYFLNLAARTLATAQHPAQSEPVVMLANILSARAQLALALDVLTFDPAQVAPQVLAHHAARDLMTAASLTRTAATVSDPDTAQALDLTAQLVTKRAQVLDRLTRTPSR